ncbi:hypothetical protein ACDH70_09110 [Xanthomonas axonopodis pv. poinsettiicola]|uniref:Uncharacterized protein n=1 Tax=Xanthomonas codiaei TaxID=56463 RepID=A0A2S7CY18_9XANT|nr:hypothetical protein [Xanthomonas codiaei]MCC8535767.1 hypothetical protein [Xanthomonas codiaei]PPU66354.1 hypothetical protein XcodCFBP4690_02155 [Xanthomonas codiaei]
MHWLLAWAHRSTDAALQIPRLVRRPPLVATDHLLQGNAQPLALQRPMRGGGSARCRSAGVKVAIGEMGAGNPAGLS